MSGRQKDVRGRSNSPSAHARGTSPSPKPKAPTGPRNSKDPRPLVPTSVLAAGSKEAAVLSAQLAAALAETSELYPSADTSRVPLNARGGVAVSPEELRAGYDMLDLEKSGYVTLTSLRKRLGFFFPDMTPKEYRFLMNNRKVSILVVTLPLPLLFLLLPVSTLRYHCADLCLHPLPLFLPCISIHTDPFQAKSQPPLSPQHPKHLKSYYPHTSTHPPHTSTHLHTHPHTSTHLHTAHNKHPAGNDAARPRGASGGQRRGPL